MMEFYRYENGLWDTKVAEYTYYLVRETDSGYWIHSNPNYDESNEPFYGKKRWVSKTSRKRYAYPTREEAIDSFKARKNRQILMLIKQLEVAKAALSYIERHWGILP